MTLTPLDQFDPRLRQVCAALTKAQLKARQQQLEIDALLAYVLSGGNKAVQGVELSGEVVASLAHAAEVVKAFALTIAAANARLEK